MTYTANSNSQRNVSTLPQLLLYHKYELQAFSSVVRTEGCDHKKQTPTPINTAKLSNNIYM